MTKQKTPQQIAEKRKRENDRSVWVREQEVKIKEQIRKKKLRGYINI